MPDPFVELAAGLQPALASKLAAGLEIDGRLGKALEKLDADSDLRDALRAAHAAVGPVALASVLRGFVVAGQAHSTDLRAVWSGPTFEGDTDHTTSALAFMIDEATEDVFASTYSASSDSAFVAALWRAVARGVAVTVLVDAKIRDGGTAQMLQTKLEGARFWTYRPEPGVYAVQHSKVVLVDSRSAFVTSANLSVAAEERNLEAGVIIRDAGFASSMRQRFDGLRAAGAIEDL